MTARPRLLLLTYFFPPHNPTESRRGLVIARAATGAGWDVDVIAPWAPNFHSDGAFTQWRQCLDERRISVHRTPGRFHEVFPGINNFLNSLLRLSKVGKRIREVMVFPDRCVSWLYFLIPRAVQVSMRHRPDVILTSSYPYSAHIAGLIISKIFRIPWILDTRDGWAADESEQFLLMGPSLKFRKWHRFLMLQAFSRAGEVWTLTPGIQDAMKASFGGRYSDKVKLVMQGFDLTACGNEAKRVEKRQGKEMFIIGYAGRFRPDITPAEPIAVALRFLKKTKPEVYKKTVFRVWGYKSRWNARYLIELLSKHGVVDCLDHRDSLPENELIEELQDCDALLLTIGSSEWSKRRLTTKLFTYLAAQRPILAVCARKSAIEELIRETNVGITVPCEEPKSLARALRDMAVARFQNKSDSFRPNQQALQQYSWQRGVMPAMVEGLRKTALFDRLRPGR